MARFLWTNNLSTGHPKIDDDHRKLFEMINAFQDALEQQRGKELTERVLNNLVTYYRIHFQREEAAMQHVGYPDYVEHKLEHEKFIAEVDLLVQNFKKGATINPVYVGRMLSDWLRNHIVHTDTKMALLLKDWHT